jgi:hypothetical protein
MVYVYGGGLGLLFFLLTLRGIIELVLRKLYVLLFILLLWPAYSLLYILLIFQPTHFLFSYYVVFFLTSVGLTAIVSAFGSRGELFLWSGVLLGIAILGIVKNQPLEFPLAALVFLLGLWIVYITMQQYSNNGLISQIGTVLLLVVLLTLGGYPKPKVRELGIAPDERAMLFLREYLKPGTCVGASAPVNVVPANMTFVAMHPNTFLSMNSEQDLLTWIANRNVKAIYVDNSLRFNESVWKLLERQIGKNLTVAFTSDNGEVQVLSLQRHFYEHAF